VRILLAPEPWRAPVAVWLGSVIAGQDLLRQLGPGDRLVTIEVVTR
jgi:hypothetical protein